MKNNKSEMEEKNEKNVKKISGWSAAPVTGRSHQDLENFTQQLFHSYKNTNTDTNTNTNTNTKQAYAVTGLSHQYLEKSTLLSSYFIQRSSVK